MKDTLIILPAYNEEKNIGCVLDGIHTAGCEADIIVVNDGSSDQTANVAEERGVGVITLPFNLGYGAALQTGFQYALRKGYSYCIQFDADGQHSPEDIERLQSEIRKGDADMIIGTRFGGNGTLHVSRLKLLSIKLFRRIIRKNGHCNITDPTSGLKALSRPLFECYSHAGNFPHDFPDADILIRTLRSGFAIREITATMQERMNGKGMHEGLGLKQAYYMLKILLSIFVVLIQEPPTKKEGARNG